jgi:hypothetical protein
MLDERETERVLAKLESLRGAIIDASSIIYIERSGFYRHLNEAIKLKTIPAVLKEVQMPGLEVQVIDGEGPETNTDRRLVATASASGSPLISEDRAILLTCQAKGIEYYNAYMMLLLLRLRRAIAEGEFERFRTRLIEVARYGRPVLDYAGDISRHLDKTL